MAGFLDQMAAGSRARADDALARVPLAALRARCAELPPPPPLVLGGQFDVIAELKLRSPALGALGRVEDGLVERVRAYAAGGAAAVSVLTEPDRFDGSLDHLASAAAALAPLGVPAMRKDFLVDPYQLYEARAEGAGGALLIIRMLSRDTLGEMLDCARELGLFVLLEAFDEADLEVAAELVSGSAKRAGATPDLPGARAGSGRATAPLARPELTRSLRVALATSPARPTGGAVSAPRPWWRGGPAGEHEAWEKGTFPSSLSVSGHDAADRLEREEGNVPFSQAASRGVPPAGSRPRREALDADPARAPGDVAACTASVLVGVNCRDLQTLEVVPSRFAALSSHLPAGVPRVAESGLETAADVEAAVRAGYDVALIGGALMRAGDPRSALGALLAAGRGAAA